LASLPFAWIYLLPESFIDFSKSILYSLGFSSNFYFHYSGQIYGAESGLLKPFLHTWSLSVEEQYYILIPIILFITFKYFRKYLIYILMLSFIINLGLADRISRNYPSISFYFLHTRMWELLAGSILAYFEIKLGHRSQNKTLNLIIPSIGLFLIGHSILFFNDKMFHPSFYTLSPIIGVCLIIWFSNKNEIITKIFSSKLFVGVGLISYSLYLWHYTIFAFIRISKFTEGILYEKLLIGAFILILSIISYYFIERPARNKKIKIKSILIILILVVLSILSFNFFVIYKDGLSKRFLEKIYFNNIISRPQIMNNINSYIDGLNMQDFQSKDKVKILIVGDSHAQHLFTAFNLNKDLFNEYEFLWYRDNNNALNFKKYNSTKNIETFENSKIYRQSDVILISNYFSDEASFDMLENFIKLFKNKKKLILTSLNNIYLDKLKFKRYYDLTLFDYFLIKNKGINHYIDKDLTEEEIFLINSYYFNNIEKNKSNKVNEKLEIISNKYNIKLLFKKDYQCQIEKQICYGVTDEGFKVYYDYGHNTLNGAKYLGKKIYETNWLNIN